MRLTTASISSRAALFSSAIRAPVPAALPATLHLRQITIRYQPQHHGVFHVDVGAKRARQSDFVDVGDFQFIHQQLHARIKRGFGHLDGAHVILRDADQRFVGLIRRLTNDIVEGALPRFNAGADGRHAAVNQSILIDDARQIHFSNGFNNAAAANACHTRVAQWLLQSPAHHSINPSR